MIYNRFFWAHNKNNLIVIFSAQMIYIIEYFKQQVKKLLILFSQKKCIYYLAYLFRILIYYSMTSTFYLYKHAPSTFSAIDREFAEGRSISSDLTIINVGLFMLGSLSQFLFKHMLLGLEVKHPLGWQIL